MDVVPVGEDGALGFPVVPLVKDDERVVLVDDGRRERAAVNYVGHASSKSRRFRSGTSPAGAPDAVVGDDQLRLGESYAVLELRPSTSH
jgi:hypothetical protein